MPTRSIDRTTPRKSPAATITSAEQVDDYIRAQAPEVQGVLREVRNAARRAAPQAEERISYGMPALFQHGVLIYFGAFKRHIGVFPPVADDELARRLARYAGPKGNLQLPLGQPMPLDLIAEVVRARLRANLAKAAGSRKPTGGAKNKP